MLENGTYDIASRRPLSYFLAGRRCRKICSTNTKSKQSKPPKPLIYRVSSGGEIGRRARLRIWFRKECGFESHPEHFPSFLISTAAEIAFEIPNCHISGDFFSNSK